MFKKTSISLKSSRFKNQGKQIIDQFCFSRARVLQALKVRVGLTFSQLDIICSYQRQPLCQFFPVSLIVLARSMRPLDESFIRHTEHTTIISELRLDDLQLDSIYWGRAGFHAGSAGNAEQKPEQGKDLLPNTAWLTVIIVQDMRMILKMAFAES